MILAIKSDGATTYLGLLEVDSHSVIYDETWDSGRQLATELLLHISALVTKAGHKLADLTGVVAYIGPGSFTSLRVSLATVNALADSLWIPSAGATGEQWLADALSELKARSNHQLLMPVYGAEANITRPQA